MVIFGKAGLDNFVYSRIQVQGTPGTRDIRPQRPKTFFEQLFEEFYVVFLETLISPLLLGKIIENKLTTKSSSGSIW